MPDIDVLLECDECHNKSTIVVRTRNQLDAYMRKGGNVCSSVLCKGRRKVLAPAKWTEEGQ